MAKLSDLKNIVEGAVASATAGYNQLAEYRRMQKLNKVKVLFLTSDYTIWGMHEDLDALVNNDMDIAMIDGLERVFFGDDRRGIVTYRDTDGTPYVIISDGNHQVIDINAVKERYLGHEKRMTLDDMQNTPEKAARTLNVRKLLNRLKIRDFGFTLDLNLGDDHKDKKDLTIYAKKVMNHTLFKSLNKLPFKMLLMVFFLGSFLTATILLTFQFVLFMLYIVLRLII